MLPVEHRLGRAVRLPGELQVSARRARGVYPQATLRVNPRNLRGARTSQAAETEVREGFLVLCASRDEKAGRGAAEELVQIEKQPDRRLDLERFVAVSPRLVRERIAAAGD